MPRKGLPIFHKVSDLLRFSVLVHKLRKPIIPKLLLLKKLRKRKEFKLLRHYNYGFIGEFQFSLQLQALPSFITIETSSRIEGTEISVPSSICIGAWGNFKVGGGGGSGTTGESQLEALPMPPSEIEDAIIAEDLFDSGDEGESVDEKAERFIERFYPEKITQSPGNINSNSTSNGFSRNRGLLLSLMGFNYSDSDSPKCSNPLSKESRENRKLEEKNICKTLFELICTALVE